MEHGAADLRGEGAAEVEEHGQDAVAGGRGDHPREGGDRQEEGDGDGGEKAQHLPDAVAGPGARHGHQGEGHGGDRVGVHDLVEAGAERYPLSHEKEGEDEAHHGDDEGGDGQGEVAALVAGVEGGPLDVDGVGRHDAPDNEGQEPKDDVEGDGEREARAESVDPVHEEGVGEESEGGHEAVGVGGPTKLQLEEAPAGVVQGKGGGVLLLLGAGLLLRR